MRFNAKLHVVGGDATAVGGVERYVGRFVQAWSDHNRMPVTVSPTDSALFHSPARARAVWRVARALRETARRGGSGMAVWVQYGNLLDGLHLLVARRAGASAVLCTVHAGPQWRSFRWPLVRRVARWLLASADIVCAFGTSHATYLRGLGLPRVAEVPTLLPASALQAEPPRAALPPRVVFVGRPAVSKGFDTLRAALARVDRPFELHVAGAPAAAYFPAKEGAGDTRVPGARFRAVYHGALGESELVSLLRTASVVVLPSRAEAWPLVLLEAMAVGVPVVACPLPGVDEMLSVYGGHSAGSCDPIALAGAIDRVLAAQGPPPDWRAVRRHHAWPVVIARYESVLAAARAGRRG